MVSNDPRDDLHDKRDRCEERLDRDDRARAVGRTLLSVSQSDLAAAAPNAAGMPAHEPHRATSFPRFSLRTMLIVVAAACILFALMGAVGPLGSVFLTWCALLVFAHVAANAWGTRAARRSSTPLAEPAVGAPPTKLAIERAITRTIPSRLEPRNQLGAMTVAVTAAGAALGAAAGAIVLLVLIDGISLAGAAVGGFSAGVIGALFGFLASTFVRTTFGAWREAAAIDAPRAARRWLIWRRAK